MRALPTPLAAALVLALGHALAAPRAGAQERVRVVANPETPVAQLTRDQLSRLFLKKDRHWVGGIPVAPVDLPEDSPTRASFTRAVHRRSVELVRLYWEQQIFSGRNAPPPGRGSDADVLAYVRATRGAIGYVSAAADTHGVKVLEIR